MPNEELKVGKRLFLALPVEGSLNNDSLSWQADHVGWPINWLSGNHLHITVVSPWLETEVDKVLKKLEEFISQPRHSFFINFDKVTFGPNRQNPRLIWAEGKAPQSLLRLKDDLEFALNRPDPRFYRLHLTLGRFKIEDFGQTLPNLYDRIDWGAEIKSLILFESILQPEGIEYLKVKEFPFAV